MWEITNTAETIGKAEDGSVGKGVNATVKIVETGQVGTVFVPDAVLMAGEAGVRALVDKYAAALGTLKGLKS